MFGWEQETFTAVLATLMTSAIGGAEYAPLSLTPDINNVTVIVKVTIMFLYIPMISTMYTFVYISAIPDSGSLP